ncbi:MAG: pantetheine-phosphate adenylyltransferase [Bdellovibrionales bacterium]|nr:pantetheine-phosphate adenylyltransferase [Bdellovibrionales bacterium]
MKTLVYAGSFDPITLGHLDIIKRASNLCDKLIVVVFNSQNKKYQFTTEQRLDFLKKSTENIKNIETDSSQLLLADYMNNNGHFCLVRGLRGAESIDLEESMFVTNKTLSDSLESIFLFASPKYRHISSSLVKELAPYPADLKNFVPLCVAEFLKK